MTFGLSSAWEPMFPQLPAQPEAALHGLPHKPAMQVSFTSRVVAAFAVGLEGLGFPPPSPADA